jgi:hypothetical protein
MHVHAFTVTPTVADYNQQQLWLFTACDPNMSSSAERNRRNVFPFVWPAGGTVSKMVYRLTELSKLNSGTLRASRAGHLTSFNKDFEVAVQLTLRCLPGQPPSCA